MKRALGRNATVRRTLSDDIRVPSTPSERGPWLIALALLVLGMAVLAAALAGAFGSPTAPVAAPPAVLEAAQTPTVASASSRAKLAGRGASLAGPYAGTALGAHDARGGGGVRQQALAAATGGVLVKSASVSPSLASGPVVHIPAAWEAGFYSIYAEAQHTFGVNWLLLASIHDQESAFSTAPSTYHGLNFAHCCGGPMQFNVTNGPVSTWQLVRNAYLYGKRPAAYDHQTTHHPSIYDDFDSVMAAAWLLSSDGAGAALDDSAWWAAYDYYGHDATGVSYADEVLARAIGWSQHGFCINCSVEPALVQAVHAAYGTPVLETLTSATLARARRAKRRR